MLAHRSGLKVDSSAQFAGLFGYIQGGTVQALTLAAPDVKSVFNGQGNKAVGAVVGLNSGAIENCHVEGGTITGNRNSGGVAGVNSGTVTGCSSSAGVTGSSAGGVAGGNAGGVVTASYATGDVTATGNTGNAGGVVGLNYNLGSVATVTACYSTGAVNGSTAGGVVGHNSYDGINVGTVTACYWSGTVDGNKGIGDAADDDDLTGKAIKVTGNITWETAATAMNNAIAEWNQNATVKCNYSYDTSSPPKLKAGAPSSTAP